MPDTVTLVLDANQYYSELAKVTARTQGLGRAGGDIGSGFLRGERAFRGAATNITQGLLTAQNAGDAAIITFQGLERVFKIGIAPIAFAAGLIGGLALIQREVKKTSDAFDALHAELSHPLLAEINLSPEDIASRIDAVTKATQKLEERQKSVVGSIVHAFYQGSPTGPGSIQAEVEAGQKRTKDLAFAQAEQELKVANLKKIENEQGKEAAEIARAQLTFEEKRAKLIEEFASKGGNVFDFYKRFAALQVTMGETVKSTIDAAASKAKEVLDKMKETAATAAEKLRAATEAATKTPGQAASERRTVRDENRREKELRDQLSREGDSSKREDIKDQLTEIQQARDDRAKKQQQLEVDRQAAQQNAADTQAAADAEAQRQAAAKAAEQRKAQDDANLKKFGRVLSPDEQAREDIKDREEARQQKFQDDDARRQQEFNDRQERESRGISQEQLDRERAFQQEKDKRPQEESQKDFSSVNSLAGKDFSGMASLGGLDFRGLFSLNGLSITIR